MVTDCFCVDIVQGKTCMTHLRVPFLASVIIILIVLSGCWAYAEHKDIHLITFRDDTRVTGKIVHIDSEYIQIEVDEDQIVIRKFSDVVAIAPISGKRVAKKARPLKGSFSIFGGTKTLRKSDFNPAHKNSEIGIQCDAGKETWPVHVVTGILFSMGIRINRL